MSLIATSAAPGLGQGITVPFGTHPDSALGVELDKIGGTPITLQDAVRAALDGGSTLAQSAAASLAAARGSHKSEQGAFDPEIFFTGATREVEEPTASPFAGATVLETRRTAGVGGLRMLFPFGTEIEASLDAARTESNSIYASLNPQHDALGWIGVRQPFLRGFGPGTGSESKATRREAEAAKSRYDDVILAVEALVEQTYWDLYAADRDLAVGRIIRDQATALETQADLRARSGLVGPSDVANARVFLATQEQSVLDQEENLDNVSDRLASLIGVRPPAGSPRFRPTDDPPAQFPIEPEDSVVARAVRENRELRARDQQVAAARARVQGAAWNRLPQLDFFGTLGGRGLSGDSSNTSGGFDDAWSQVRERDFPTWSAGIQVSIPIFLREGRGEYDRLRGEEERAAQDFEQARRILGNEVRSAHRALVRASKRFGAAQDGADASREQVRIGVLQYNSGQTTAFELVRLGADLATAQQRYSQALVRTAKAASALRYLTSGAYPARAITGGSTKP